MMTISLEIVNIYSKFPKKERFHLNPNSTESVSLLSTRTACRFHSRKTRKQEGKLKAKDSEPQVNQHPERREF